MNKKKGSEGNCHNLSLCITNRLNWRYNIWIKVYKQKDSPYYCSLSDFDKCKACEESESYIKEIIIQCE